MTYGWAGRRVRVDLTSGKAVKENLGINFLKDFLGGRGFNVRVLYDLVNSRTDPLGARNPLIFGTGPITGTLFPSNGRYNVTAKSPLTGILGDSNSGGFWGPELKFAGYDQILIEGRSKTPVYLWIDDDEIQIKDATKLWGKTTCETDMLIKEEIGDESIQIACIGQGGENLVKYAAIINNLARAAGRTGMGAVMGSKNLKAVVVRGSKSVNIAHPELFEKFCREMTEEIFKSPAYTARSIYGTTMIININNMMGILPTKNSQDGVFEVAENISGETLKEKYNKKNKACFSCPVHCSRYFFVDQELYGEGPEYETLCSYGSRILNDNLESILKANNMSNQYGIDTISTGNVIAFAMEAYDKGIITKDDTGGMEFTWGNKEVLVEAIRKIAFREGFGNILAEGVKKASEIIGKGTEKFALHVKGLDPPCQEPRAQTARGLSWATSSRGADHLRAFLITEASFYAGRPVDDISEQLKYMEDLTTIASCMEMCEITWFALKVLQPDFAAKVIYSVTDWNLNKTVLLKIGERITNLERMFNIREGIRRKDDNLPVRYLKEPITKGPTKGKVFMGIESMLDRYYDLRGWEKKTGIPTKEKLGELGILQIVENKRGV